MQTGANHQHVRYCVKGIVYLAQIPREELHCTMQCCGAVLLCPFNDLSNGHVHTLQCPPVEVKSKALDFVRFMWQIVLSSSCDWRYILNMDQTPVYFSMNAKRTLELIGEKTVYICTSPDDTKQVTEVVTIAADGTVLPSMLIFKGQPGRRIEKTEFATYPATHHYRCQANA
jgi:hypothetical protein